MARTWLGDWPGGVYFCDLSRSAHARRHSSRRAARSSVPLGKDDPGVQLGHAIAGRGRCLVILDNFEQVVAARAPRPSAAGSTARPTPRSWSRAASGCTCRRGHASRRAAAADDGGDRALRGARARAASRTSRSTTRNRADRGRGRAPARRPAAGDRARGRAHPRAVAGAARRSACATASSCSPARAARRRARRRCGRRSTGRGICSRRGSRRRSRSARCSRAASRSTRPRRCSTSRPGREAPPVDRRHAGAGRQEPAAHLGAGDRAATSIDEPYFGMYLSIHEYAAEKSGERAARNGPLRRSATAGYFAASAPMRRSRRSTHGGIERLQALALELDNLVAACRRAVCAGDGEVRGRHLSRGLGGARDAGPFGLAVELGAAGRRHAADRRRRFARRH